jgi:hypothetical protein
LRVTITGLGLPVQRFAARQRGARLRTSRSGCPRAQRSPGEEEQQCILARPWTPASAPRCDAACTLSAHVHAPCAPFACSELTALDARLCRLQGRSGRGRRSSARRRQQPRRQRVRCSGCVAPCACESSGGWCVQPHERGPCVACLLSPRHTLRATLSLLPPGASRRQRGGLAGDAVARAHLADAADAGASAQDEQRRHR